MPTDRELEASFWDALQSDGVMMLGLAGVEEGHTRPMTAQIENGKGPIWFFTARDAGLVKNIDKGHRAVATFASRGHDVFAAVHGNLVLDNDRAVIDRLWNSSVAAWYPGGKDDPNLALLRLNPDQAQIWQDGSNLVAGIKMLLGADPKQEYQDQVAKVDLR